MDKTATTVDADLLRDFFDKKVAHVVRKEALVDKLAQEWEIYFELNTQLNERSNAAEVGDDADEEEEALQTLEVQLRFQSDKIRKLARRLGNKSLSQESVDDPSLSNSTFLEGDAFLFDKEFSDLCSGK